MTQQSSFHMADVRRKRPTSRRALAVGERYPGANLASILMPLCDPLQLEKVGVCCLAVRRVPGLAESFRSASRQHTARAWLSRADAVMIGTMSGLALPGSPRVAAQGIAMRATVLTHARSMIEAGAHA